MANPISGELAIGTMGELLVQLRLLQYDVQAAPPLRDSGNDLIALRGFEVRCIQVKTTRTADVPGWPPDKKRYHLLAIVRLLGEGRDIRLDESRIYLLSKQELAEAGRSWPELERFALGCDRIDQLFQ